MGWWELGWGQPGGWQRGVALGTSGGAAFLSVLPVVATGGVGSVASPRLTCPHPSVWLSEVDEEALLQLSVPAELAQKVLQVLEKRCQGSCLRDLRGSRVYARHFLGRGAEQDGGGSSAVSSEGDGCRSSGPEGTMAKAAEEDLSAAAGPPQARSVAVKSDSQLFSELFEREGLFLPEVTEEQSQGNVLLRVGAQARCWKRRCCLHGGRLWAGHGEPCSQRLPEVGGLRCWVCVCAAPWELLEVSLLP